MKKSVTPFQDRVYRACREIPAGRVSTYAELARRVGCGSPRAVGQALKCNPFAPEVPCHRVVASSRELGGFSGHSAGPEVARKKALLLEEGVGFETSGKIKPDFVWKFSLAKCESSV
ncbi:MAG: MGMT family protein [Verrucomicrobia bacterium]|nr:MGMT family protein [Verrucomicrobiota bacterium]MCH8510655.1 MGMT family protein [Kiritimatiellia bacterium]